MKTYLYILTAMVYAVLLAACTKEDIITRTEGGEGTARVTLQVRSSDLQSRATEAGDDAYNENKINRVDCFFYPAGKTGESAVFHHAQVFTNTTNEATITATIPTNVKDLLFPTGATTCEVYVVANYPSGGTWPDNTAVNNLKALSVQADFTKIQGDFVMDGSTSSVTLATDGKSIDSTDAVPLERSAAKIGLFATVVNEVEDEAGNKWVSQPEAMEISFRKGVKKGYIDGTGSPYTPQSGDYFNVDERGFTKQADSEFYTHAPFYSYPSDWSESANSDKEAYLVLSLPWKKEDETEYKPCYYQIPINDQGKELTRNDYYKIKLNVSMLGDFLPDKPVELNPSYIILNWGTEQISASMQNYRYLVVDRNYVVMDNVNEVSIGFVSSHDVEIVDATMKKPNLSKQDVGTDIVTNKIEILRTEELADGRKMIYFKHPLDNDQSDKAYDYVPYTLEFDVRHKDNENFIEHITIVQYPAMYIVAEKNEGGNIVNDNKTDNDDKGFVFVNGNQYYSGDNWQVVRSCEDGGNNNPNMYIINVSAFVNGETYSIGDVRSEESNKFGLSELTHYYPTRTDGGVINMIAPQFRIASSYGKCGGSIGKNDAQKRCAAYQEQGFPAGRWRVPTKAELRYIAQLSSEGKIPHLFSNNGNYWTSNGLCVYNNNGSVTDGSGNSAFVRCIYDEWYWTDKCDKTQFTWGDK